MHEDWLSRTNLLLGQEKLDILKTKNVLVVGLGGVGSYAAETIARAGVGKMTIVDGDVVNLTNLNRQLPALRANLGQKKAKIMEERLLDINPDLQLTVIDEFIRDDFMKEILQSDYDYVLDAIDTLSPKVFLIHHTLERKHKLVSSMGAGGKIDPAQVKIAPLTKSFNCKFAFIVRKRLSKLGSKKDFPVVFSPEQVDKTKVIEVEGEQNKKSIVGTISYMPAIFGMFCASVVLRDLTGDFTY
jgi:tRNA A37 threonylcarbamoyladenosine dehydratase